MTVEELIKELEKYDPKRKVYGLGLDEIEVVEQKIWIHSNYPYDKPDEIRLVIS